jgi:hypothetical protein
MEPKRVWKFLPPPEKATERQLSSAIVEVSDGLEDGIACPCCGQLAKMYARPITPAMGAWLVSLVCAAANRRGKWLHVKHSLLRQTRGGDYAKLLYWELIKKRPPSGKKKRSGFWQPTEKGIDFVNGRVLVPRKALIYDEVHVGFMGGSVSIEDVLSEHFDVESLRLNPNMPKRVKHKAQRTVR